MTAESKTQSVTTMTKPSTKLDQSVQSPDYIKNLVPYKSGKPISELVREKGLTHIVKLASNENPLGCSPLALEAALESLGESYRYVDPGAFELTKALSEYHNRPQDEIICGAGTDSLLSYIISAFSEEGDEILTPEATFIGMFVNARKLNRKIVTVPMVDYAFDLPAITAAFTTNTKIVYIANPNNPTGSMVGQKELDRFIESVPSNVLIILDEAYYNYACSDEDYPDGMQYRRGDRNNLIITRTFSKDYGLAGMRVGYAVGPEKLIHQLYKVKLPFEPSHPAQSAAIAALNDTEFVAKTIELNQKSMKQLADGLDSLGIKYIPSHANFWLMIFKSEEQAATFAEECLIRGLILRHTKMFGAPCGVRINSGTIDDGKFALEVIEKVWSKLKTM